MSNEQAAGQQFAVQRIYVKDMSFESPLGADVFIQQWKPTMKVDLNTRNRHVEGDNHEVVLTVTVTAELEGKTAFLVEAQQAGLFMLKGFTEDQQKHVLGIMCPNLLFPYVRELLDGAALKGGFPAIGLQPVNFEALYQQAMAQQQQEQSAAH